MNKRTASLTADEEWEREVWRLLEEQFGAPRLPGFRLLRSGKNRIRLISEEAYQLVGQTPTPRPAGLYFGEQTPEGIRLSIEGAQLVGPKATRQVVNLTPSQADIWLQGQPVRVQDQRTGFVIVRQEGDILGCGRLSQGLLHSFIPKVRRPKEQRVPTPQDRDNQTSLGDYG